MTPAASVCSRYTTSSIVCKSFINEAQCWVSLTIHHHKWDLVHISTNCQSGIWCWYRLGLCRGIGLAEVDVNQLSAISVYSFIGWSIMNRRKSQLMLTHIRTISKKYWMYVYEEGKQIICV
uniref:Uncharacterized protein n=1 Tax=Cyanidiococcus yangmingshanensis TaxID=2690220 RepID=A0A7G5VUH4_9RHOD|nr:hypothetical protein I9961_pgp176 [Cyanidiococcus yangmingshanensis]QMX77341.1 hypothetical protein [Cyanidiococcus yangmingshanensis]UNJ15957.1 hypothetical protein [Cyanidioschyzonaceae sp. 3]WDB00351.1 hypothetical protein CCYA8123_039 [Cyanidiococcus yangmingshanensis]